jgi:excisionase family DNA binding protein
MEKLLESRQGTASALGISLRMVDYLIAQGKLRARKLGRRTLVPKSEIERFARIRD